MSYFVKGDRVKRRDTGDEAVVTRDEHNGFVEVHYDGLPPTHDRPMLQIASKFRKVTP